MENQSIFVAVTLSNGSTTIQGILIQGRTDRLPAYATWLVPGSGWWTRPASDEVIFEELQRSFPGIARDGTPLPTVVRYKVVDQTEIPADRTFRDALRHDGTKFNYEMPKARELHLKRLRYVREYKLEELDVEWMRATAKNDKQAADAVEAERQALRDAPATLGIENAATVEELKALWPVNLPPWGMK